MKKFIVASVVLVAVLMAAYQANAIIADPPVVYYSFNNASLLNGTPAGTNAFLAADTGSSISTFTYGPGFLGGPQFFAGTTVNGQPGFAAGNTASSNGSLGDATSYLQFTLNATGLQNIGVTWAAARSTSTSNAGPGTNTLEYSTNGGSSFSVAGTFVIPAATASGVFLSFTNDFGAGTALDNNPNDVFRIYYSQAYVPSTGAQSTAGTDRLDNLTVYAVIPEPSTVMLVCTGLIGLLAIRRRRA